MKLIITSFLIVVGLSVPAFMLIKSYAKAVDCSFKLSSANFSRTKVALNALQGKAMNMIDVLVMESLEKSALDSCADFIEYTSDLPEPIKSITIPIF